MAKQSSGGTEDNRLRVDSSQSSHEPSNGVAAQPKRITQLACLMGVKSVEVRVRKPAVALQKGMHDSRD